MVAAIVAIVLAAVIAGVTYVKFFRRTPAPYFASDEDHFLFGSIGTEESEDAVPYWIWLVLPRIFPEHLPRPGGYAALGVLAKGGHEMPVGFTKVTVGFPRVGVNCALCHTARWREKPGDPPTIVPGGPAHQTGVQEYERFLIASASDSRFNADTILGEIAKNYRLSALDRFLYRAVIIPSTRRELLRLKQHHHWTGERPDWGRGRVDFLGPGKAGTAAVGTADMPSIWNLNRRSGSAFYWDGSILNLREAVLASAVGSGAAARWVDRDTRRRDDTGRDTSSLRRIQNYLGALKPPPYPFIVDHAAAGEGRQIFDRECATCHARGGSRAGTIIPIAEVGTDRERLDARTKTEGYVSGLLDGVWLRAPYLHNGSVPSLSDLLEPSDRRPQQFRRGYDVYDPVKLGFVSAGADAERVGTLYDTSKPGNSNAGHLYGTELPAESKRALIEYLKTQ
jgi:mono/diheme cytochrome c family protein